MKLLFFTNSYPYGVGEIWKTNELKVLVKYFEKITVIPFGYGNQKKPVPFIEGIEYTFPLFLDGIPKLRWYSLASYKFLLSKDVFVFLSEFWNEKIFIDRNKFIAWLIASNKMYLIKQNKELKKILNTVDEATILYFYWGRETSEVLPILKVRSAMIFTRFHRYDLYKEENGGYIPYQYLQLKKMDYAFPCSEHGRNTLIKYYPDLENKIVVKRLGTISKGTATQTKSKPFVIVSCSFLEKVKRVDIILESLKFIKADVHWIHIGDGSLLQYLKTLSEQQHIEKKITFLGRLTNEEVIEFYCSNAIDLFINVSESEGVPVSIMEAFSAAIPVFATDVGGTGEIVNDRNGKLLRKDINQIELGNEIDRYIQYSYAEKERFRNNAINTYLKFCDSYKLTQDLISFILN